MVFRRPGAPAMEHARGLDRRVCVSVRKALIFDAYRTCDRAQIHISWPPPPLPFRTRRTTCINDQPDSCPPFSAGKGRGIFTPPKQSVALQTENVEIEINKAKTMRVKAPPAPRQSTAQTLAKGAPKVKVRLLSSPISHSLACLALPHLLRGHYQELKMISWTRRPRARSLLNECAPS